MIFKHFFRIKFNSGLIAVARGSDNASVHCVVSDTFFVELGPARNSPSCNQKKVDKKSDLQARIL